MKKESKHVNTKNQHTQGKQKERKKGQNSYKTENEQNGNSNSFPFSNYFKYKGINSSIERHRVAAWI